MAQVIFDSGVFKVTIKHLWQKREGGVFYYRRRYPSDIRELLEGQGQEVPTFKVVSLQTKNKVAAGRKIMVLATRDDAEWDMMRGGQPSSTVKSEAHALLTSWGLIPTSIAKQPDPERAEVELNHFIDEHQREVERKARREKWSEEEPLDYAAHLSPAQGMAISILTDTYKFRLGDVKDYYLKNRPHDKKIVDATNAAFRMITDVVGDKPLEEYKRKDVTLAIDTALATGLKTGSVERRLNTLKAAFNEFIRDEELNLINPFAKQKIKGKGEDVEERGSLNQEQLDRLRAYVRTTETATANMLGIMIDTGARPKEIAGLMREDVKLDAEVPYLVIHKNPLRRLKTKDSCRDIPLVGEALLSAQRALSESKGQGPYLFPRYMSADGVKSGNASAAMNKITQALDCKTPYWLRHTMKTRLRNVNAPESLAKEIGGWARDSVAQSYGVQTALKLMQEVLEKSLGAVLD